MTDGGSIRLLDPSCSGSGIVNRLDYLLEGGELSSASRLGFFSEHAHLYLRADEAENDEQKQERLDKLASFQLSMIQHAMTCELDT